MKPELKKRALVVFLLCLGLFAAGAILSTEEVHEQAARARTLRGVPVCHTTSQPIFPTRG